MSNEAMNDKLGYEMCLEKAGAIVHCFAEFGDYQGSWYAKVTWNGETGWVEGSYGSCTGCDSFQAEFCYYDDEVSDEKYAQFGKSYLDTIFTQEQQEQKLRKEVEDDCWGDEYKEALSFVEANK